MEAGVGSDVSNYKHCIFIEKRKTVENTVHNLSTGNNFLVAICNPGTVRALYASFGA